MGLPSNVKVADTWYAVRRMFEDESAEVHGEFSAMKQTISLVDKVSDGYSRYLLAHELVHALFEHAGANTGKPGERFTEEQVACIIGRALPALLKDNPELVRYMTND